MVYIIYLSIILTDLLPPRTVTIMYSERVMPQDIYVNNTSMNKNPARNTDGANTMLSDNITFRRWTVSNGDHCIAVKAIPTTILIEDATLYNGAQGIGLGQHWSI